MSCIVSLWIFLALFILQSLASAARAPASRLHSPGREVIVAMAWILATFLLSSNLLQYVGFVVADRVLYLPSYGFCLIAVHVLHALFSRCQLYLEKRKKSGGGNSTGKAGAEKKDVDATATAAATADAAKKRVTKKASGGGGGGGGADENVLSSSSPAPQPLRLLSVVVIGVAALYLQKQQVQTANWADPVEIWGEGFRVNRASCINGVEFGMSLVNAGRPKDAVKPLWEGHQREIRSGYFTHSIKTRHEPDTMSRKMSRLNSLMKTRFKLVTAMSNSGQCDRAEPLIDEGLQMLSTLPIEAIDAGGSGLGSNLGNNKAYMLVGKSRCQKTLALMIHYAQQAVMSRPNLPYVTDYMASLADLEQQARQSGVDPNRVHISFRIVEGQQQIERDFRVVG